MVVPRLNMFELHRFMVILRYYLNQPVPLDHQFGVPPRPPYIEAPTLLTFCCKAYLVLHVAFE